MIPTKAYAAEHKGAQLTPFSFERREPGASDVVIAIKFCGICHTDIHQVNSDWRENTYPLVPGHEIVGEVIRVGSAVKQFHKGQNVGIGCIVDSCRECSDCKAREEQFCKLGFTGTYGAVDKRHGGMTQGGYSDTIVVDEKYVLNIPKGMDLASAAPLLCAGITTYSPLMHWKVGPGMRVGVFGLGGLGHMALKLACAMGAHVVQFTTSESKKKDAVRLGAHEVVLSTDANAMAAQRGTFDFIIDTVSAPHDVNVLLQSLKRDGVVVVVGAPPAPHQVSAMNLLFGRHSLAGSLIGGIAQTQEMLDFCSKHNITADIELITPQQINEAYPRMMNSDVKYRFVIDMKKLKE